LVLLIVGRERDTQNFNAVRGKLYSHKNYNVISTTFTEARLIIYMIM
jgi:hypothetical protein